MKTICRVSLIILFAQLSFAIGADLSVEPLTIAVEPPDNKGSGQLLLRNDTGSAIDLHLRLGSFTSEYPSDLGIPLGKVSLIWLGEDGKPLATPPAKIDPNKTVVVAVDITDLWESGESTAILFNGEKRLSTITAVKYKVPLAVKLDVPTPDKPELSFTKGSSSQILLKNDDPVTYTVRWEIVVRDHLLAGPSDPVLLTPNGPGRIEVNPPDEWFSTSLSGLFKADQETARLLLYFEPPPGGVTNPKWPVKSIPFQANLFTYGEGAREVGAFLVLILCLLAGGMVSIALNNGIPNAFQQLDLKDKLQSLARRTRGLSELIEPKKRMLFTTEQQRLQELLASRASLSPDFQTVGADVRLYANLLDARLDRLSKIDALYQRLQAAASGAAPPPQPGWSRLRRGSGRPPMLPPTPSRPSRT